MIELKVGNILNEQTEALVNPVNIVGCMGKGLALQFKRAFPENFRAYVEACHFNSVQPGKMFVFETNRLYPKYIINFPTKRHWRDKSQIEDIKLGLQALVKEVKDRKIQSIAVPPLGCGLGGLEWSIVRPIIEDAFSEVHETKVILYLPLRRMG